ncbi:MAG: winged helix-turn-helix transcriptional regulator, partial [Tissierellaceae bacterium]|nr:winged helix-turn-helix transcriptional regulator [Tissierellaceae bacterium]
MDMNFFNPTALYKELLLLQEIEKNQNITQKELGDVIGAAPSMVNIYINGLEDKDYLKREYISAKTVNYIITPKGVKRKNYLAITYLDELLKLYRLAEENVENFLLRIEKKGYRNILFYGAGEVAGIILAIIKGRTDKSLKVLALVDDDKDKQGRELAGYKIISREEIKEYKHDGIVVTSYTF